MTLNNNFSVLPFYGSIAERESAKPWAYGEIYPLVASTDSLIPFFFWLDGEGDITSTSMLLKNVSGTTIATLTAKAHYLYDTDNDRVCVYTLPMSNLNLPEGRAYIEFTGTLDGETIHRYSDIITCVKESEISCYLKLMWYNKTNIYYEGGFIPYMDDDDETGFLNVLYINSEIGKPDYKFNEEGEERDGYFFASKQTSEKTYKFTFVGTESLCDALRLVRMSDFVKVIDQLDRAYYCDTFLVDVSWLEDGYLASIDAEFETDTIVKVIGKGLTGAISDAFTISRTSYECISTGCEDIAISLSGNLQGGFAFKASESWINVIADEENSVSFSIGNNAGATREGDIIFVNGLGVEKVCHIRQARSVYLSFEDGQELEPPIPTGQARYDISSTIFDFQEIFDEPVEVRVEGLYYTQSTGNYVWAYNQDDATIELMNIEASVEPYGALKTIVFKNWTTDIPSGWSVNIGTFDATDGILTLPSSYDYEDIELTSDGAEATFIGITMGIIDGE